MTKIPAPARILLDFIGDIEAPDGYPTLYGNKHRRRASPITAMTLDQVIASGPSWSKAHGSSAAGRYQFMHATLKGLKQEMKLDGKLLFDRALQDRMGLHLLRRRGYDKFINGTLGRDPFMLNLAKEWASLPVPYAVQGGSRAVQRGQSYYAGDGLNKSLVKPEAVEAAITKAYRAVIEEPGAPLPTEPEPPLDTTDVPDDPVATLWEALVKAWNDYQKAKEGRQP